MTGAVGWTGRPSRPRPARGSGRPIASRWCVRPETVPRPAQGPAVLDDAAGELQPPPRGQAGVSVGHEDLRVMRCVCLVASHLIRRSSLLSRTPRVCHQRPWSGQLANRIAAGAYVRGLEHNVVATRVADASSEILATPNGASSVPTPLGHYRSWASTTLRRTCAFSCDLAMAASSSRRAQVQVEGFD